MDGQDSQKVLSPRDIVVLDLLGKRLTHPQIAEKLCIKKGSVDKAVQRMRVKLANAPEWQVSGRASSESWYLIAQRYFSKTEQRETTSDEEVRITTTDEAIAKFDFQAERIYQARMHAGAQEAIILGQHSVLELNSALSTLVLTHATLARLLSSAARIYRETSLAIIETRPPRLAWNSLKGYMQDLENIADQYNNAEIRATAYLIHGYALYGFTQHAAATKLFAQAVTLTDNLAVHAGAERGALVSLTHLNAHTAIKKKEDAVRRLLEERPLNNEQRTLLLEGRFRSYGLRNHSQTIQSLDEFDKAITQMHADGELTLLRDLQIAHSTAQIVPIIHAKEDPWLQKRVTDGVQLARYHNYVYYAERIETYGLTALR